ncbi:AAA family ATPase [Chitinophagaceae bacterium MMS25-I14]
MLNQLDIKNFTAFEHAEFSFSPGLNVIIGTNGTGKSHILKLAYSLAKTSFNQKKQHSQSKISWQKAVADDLIRIFRPESLGRLTRRQQGHNKTQVSVAFEKPKGSGFSFSFSTRSTTEVQLDGAIPGAFAPALPIFIPTKELLSLFPGLRGLYNNYQLSIDETYPDLCERLDHPLLRGPRLDKIKDIVDSLEQMAGGAIKNENGKFYLYQTDGGRLEIDLVAEGIRKLSTLTFLLKNGSVNDTTALFWDEPEANLNPLLIKKLAEMLMLLSARKFQIIIATHSLFLLKELHILSKRNNGNRVRYFSLSANDDHSTNVDTADDLEALQDIASLEAELEQTDRFSEVI